ncbi:MAG TPA: hypothetical protein VKM55_00395 [Candidatus Lokiarchaeia archaeon]|nr:hypothetical protein [Candidatus Lokiarchaeia archaeon]
MRITDAAGREFKTFPKDTVLVLSIPYAYNPAKSFARSVKIVKWLRTTFNIPVFSPIMHTHAYDMECKKQDASHDDNYYDWDIALYEAMKQKSIFLFTRDCDISKGCIREMEWAKKNGVRVLFIEEQNDLKLL